MSRPAVLSVELENRQQLRCGNAELFQIRNLLDQTLIRAAYVLCDARAGMASKASNMHFVNDRTRRGTPERRVSFPIVGLRIHDDALHRNGGVVFLTARGVPAVLVWNDHAASIRVKENFSWVESQ